MAQGSVTNGSATGDERVGFNNVDIATNVPFPTTAQGAIASWDGSRKIIVYQTSFAVWAYNSSTRYGRTTTTGGGITSVTSSYVNLPNGGTSTGTPGLVVFPHTDRLTSTTASFNVNFKAYTNNTGTLTNGVYNDADDTRMALMGASTGTANNNYRAAIYFYSVPNAPTSILVNTAANSNKPTSVTYTAPGNGGSAITAYKTIWQTSNTWSTAGGWSQGDPSLGTYASNTVYYFNVIATNAVGDSPYGTADSWFYRTITFNANGGSSTPSTMYPTDGGALTLPAAITRTGYRFDGWNTNAAGTGTNYAAGSSYTAPSDITLYAKWTPIVPKIFNGTSMVPATASKVYNGSAWVTPTFKVYNGTTWVDPT